MNQKSVFATDSSTLILLYKTSLLEKIAGCGDFLISHSVWNELVQKSPKNELAFYKKSTITKLMGNRFQQPGAHLSGADLSVLQLYFQENCTAILSDDGAILRLCKKQAIPHYCALSILPYFMELGCLDRTLVGPKMAQLESLGRYSPNIISVAKQMYQNAIQLSITLVLG